MRGARGLPCRSADGYCCGSQPLDGCYARLGHASVVSPAELLDIYVDQLTGNTAFIANGGLHPEAAKHAHPNPR